MQGCSPPRSLACPTLSSLHGSKPGVRTKRRKSPPNPPMRLEPLQPGSVVGILGGGQLGRFLAIAAAKLGFRTAVYAPEDDSPAFQVASQRWAASYDDGAALTAFAKACGVITFEFENVPAGTLERAARHAPVRPPARAAAVTQDRIAEKRFISDLGLPVAPQIAIESEADIEAACAFLA